MTFDPFASIAIICVLLIIVIIVQAMVISKILDRASQERAELTNKLMSKDFKDYSDGKHLIDMGLAAQIKAKTTKKKPEPEEVEEEQDEFPVV